MSGDKVVHVWRVKCASCGKEFDHIFRARDIFRPHLFTALDFRCPGCGSMNFDQVTPLKKESLEQWKLEHPDLDIESLPDYSYLETET